MRKRRLWLSAVLLLAFLVVAVLALLRARGAPEAARLLPESDAILYLNLKPLRVVMHFGDKPFLREPEDDSFQRETGIQVERDLDEVAIAVHAPEASAAKTIAGKANIAERRFSQIYVGRFDYAKLVHYLHKISSTVENHGTHDIFLIPRDGRTVRVSVLSVDMVAVSNTNDPGNMEHMIDHYHKMAMPFGGSGLLREYYPHVPFASSAWAISKMTGPDGQAASLPLPGGINFTLPRGTVTVGSLRYSGSIDIKAEAFTTSSADAKQLTESANTFLTLFRAVEGNVELGGPDPDVKRLFDSIHVEQKNDRAVLSAVLPQGFIKKILNEAPVEAVSPQALEKAPDKKQKRKH